jgi:UDP-N-acetylmuramate-alanine ligase
MAEDIVKKTLACSREYRQLGERLLERAYEQLQAGEISLGDYNSVSQLNVQLVQKSQEINNAAIYVLAQHLDADLQPILQATEDLKGAVRRLELAQAVVSIAAKLLAAAAAVASAVAAPLNVAGILAAAMLLGSVVEEILKQVRR